MSSRTLFQTEEVALASYIAFEKRHHDRDFVFISQVVGAAFLSSGVCSSATTPLRFAMTSPPSGCQRTFTFELSNMLGTQEKRPAEVELCRPFVGGCFLEVERAVELQRAHVRAAGQTGDQADRRALNVGIRKPEIGVVKGVSCFRLERKVEPFCDLKGLRE